jgi:heme oxygenase
MPPSGVSRSIGAALNSTKHDVSSTSLPSLIHSATRDYHTVLNRLITARLPLCVPPYTDSPFLYLSGIRRFARIYFAFEDALDSIVRDDERENENKELPHDGLEDIQQTKLDVKTALRSLQLPRLARTQRLRNDISLLEHYLGAGKPHMEVQKDEGEQAQAFVAHIRRTVSEKPHVLLAYTWVMYMALFNGGRWMRSQLLNAGEPYWTGHNLSGHKNTMDGCFGSSAGHQRLSFWFFDDGKNDGEDIKVDFRERFLAISESLTEEEGDEVVHEAVAIFQRLTVMVEELDSDGKKVSGLIDNSPCSVDGGRAFPLFGIIQYVHNLWTSRWNASADSAASAWWTGKPVLRTATSDTQ